MRDPGVLLCAFDSIDEMLLMLESSGSIEVFDGESVWLPRTVREPLYECVTAPVRLRTLHHTMTARGGVSVILSAFIASSWHLQIARTYFADVYLSSHDEQAFFEYVYHRISGLRYLAILQQVLIDQPGHDWSVGSCLRRLTPTCR